MKLCHGEDGLQYSGSVRGITISCMAFLWAFFQLFIASPLPFWLASNFGVGWVVLAGVKSRIVHLAFALFLLFLVMPTVRKEGHKTFFSVLDWVLAIAASGSVAYIFICYDALSLRIAMPTLSDLTVASVGVLLLLEAARRAIGFPVVVVSLTFLLYAVFGFLLPDLIAHKGYDIASIASHEWLSSEGVFGVALSVSCNFVFLYVLFGALLDKAGAGSFFMRLSFALLRGSIGGPGKAAVIASGFMGMMSGSSVANTITIGSFTIPLMKKMGMTPEKAAAVEVSAGINGQVTPPVMGAAAFLMAEFLSLPYPDIIKHAFVPALMVYIGLLAIVHLEACRLGGGAQAGSHSTGSPWFVKLIKFLICACSVVMLFGFVHIVIDGVHIGSFYIPGIKAIFREGSLFVIAILLFVIYIGILLWGRKGGSEFADDDNAVSIDDTSTAWDILRQGLHYFVPVFILVWSLVIERVSSSLACFWTNMFLVFMLLAEGVVGSLCKGDLAGIPHAMIKGLGKVYSAMVASSKNMLAIAVATATAGIVVGTVGLTGFGLTIGSFVDVLAAGSVFVALVATAMICIVLGMGMPTTGCYVIVSTLVVPVLSMVVHKNGLTVPPVALHLFVFYFGLMADVTPPVGIASYAAAAIARANSFKTGVQSFLYNIKTMVVPFMFVFNSDIILYGVKNVWLACVSIVLSLVSIISISAGMQGYFIRKNHLYESVGLVVIGMMLMMPNYIAEFFINNRADVSIGDGGLVNTFSVKQGDSILVNFERGGVSSSGNTLGSHNRGYVVVPIGDKFEGSMQEILQTGVGVTVGVSSSATDGKLPVLNVLHGSYVSSDLERGDSITKLSILRKTSNGNYVRVLSLGLLVVLAFMQFRDREVRAR